MLTKRVLRSYQQIEIAFLMQDGCAARKRESHRARWPPRQPGLLQHGRDACERVQTGEAAVGESRPSALARQRLRRAPTSHLRGRDPGGATLVARAAAEPDRDQALCDRGRAADDHRPGRLDQSGRDAPSAHAPGHNHSRS